MDTPTFNTAVSWVSERLFESSVEGLVVAGILVIVVVRQLFKVVRQSLDQEGFKCSDGGLVETVHLVDNGFKVIQLGKSFKNHGKLVAVNPTIAHEDAVNDLCVKELASS